MNDQEFEAQRQRILALIDKWVTPLGLRWWRLGFVYYREGLPRPDDDPEGVTLFYVTSRWRYLTAHIKVNIPAIADLDDARLEWGFVHEMCHVLVNETRENGGDWLDHEERVCSTLANAFIWAREVDTEDSKGEMVNLIEEELTSSLQGKE